MKNTKRFIFQKEEKNFYNCLKRKKISKKLLFTEAVLNVDDKAGRLEGKKVLDEYCEWMFPIVLELSKRVGIVDDGYQNRYPGFVAERLLNYYFDSRSDRCRIAYADKSFLK